MNNVSQEYQEVTDTLDIPRHAGVEGFLVSIRGILRLPRVVNISIDSRGKITYTRYARPSEPRKNIEVDFDSVAPSAIIRNGAVTELDVESTEHNAAVCLARMFARAAADHMYPVGWVIGGDSHFRAWHMSTTGVDLPEESAYALPVYRDRFIPDEALLLACAYGPNAALIDARVAYKITMPSPHPPARVAEPTQEAEGSS